MNQMPTKSMGPIEKTSHLTPNRSSLHIPFLAISSTSVEQLWYVAKLSMFLKIKLYICELDYHTCRVIFDNMNMETRESFDIFDLWPQILESWPLTHNMLCG